MNRQTLREHLLRLDGAHENLLTVDRFGKKDAQTLPFFQRQVEQIMERTYERQFPELMGANGDVLPISSDIDPGADTYTWYMYEPTGLAKFIAAYGDQTLPEVSIKGAEQTNKVRDAGSQYHWTTKDIRRAAFAGLNLETRLVDAARRSHDQLLHTTMLWGRMDLGLNGFINHPNTTKSVAADNGSGSTYWVDKTVEQIVADVAVVIDGTVELTNGVEKPNKCLIALKEYNLIKRRRMGAGDGNLTILQHLEAIWQDVTFAPMIDLQAANSLGNLTSSSLIAFNTDPEKADYVLPMGFTQLAPQADGLRIKVPCESVHGGCRIPVPLSIARLDEIGA